MSNPYPNYGKVVLTHNSAALANALKEIERLKEVINLQVENYAELKEQYEAKQILQAALAEPSEAVYWQWRRKDKPWANEYIFAMELQATTDDSEVRKLFTHPASKPEPLTDEEIDKMWDSHIVPVFGKKGINPIVFARAVEAAVWEKLK